MITTHPLSNQLDVACWRPPAPWVIFHLLKTFFEPLVPLKNTCRWHGIIWIHLMLHFKCLWGCFPQPDQKFQVYSSLSIHRWTNWKRRVVNKSKCKKCRKLKLQLTVISQSAYPHCTPKLVTFQTDLTIHTYQRTYSEWLTAFAIAGLKGQHRLI